MVKRTDYTHGTPSWVDLSAADLEKAEAFYGEIFGWTYAEDAVEGGGYVMAELGGASAAGMMRQAGEQAKLGIPSTWNSYISVDGIDDVAGRVDGLGGRLIAAPMDVASAGRMCVIVDPTGAVVCLWQANRHVGAGVVNEPNAYAWNELLTPDVPAAARFFEALLGWTTKAPDQGSAGSYSIFHLDGAPVAGAMSPPHDGVPPHWVVYFTVDDADTTAAKAESLGATVASPPSDTPVGRLAHLVDPQGATFAIMQPARTAPAV
jgi:predicted enzyme related to lactoylglutathione lyase